MGFQKILSRHLGLALHERDVAAVVSKSSILLTSTNKFRARKP